MGYNDRVDASFIDNYLYTGSVYIGDSGQEMRVIYDTGSDWMVIEGKDCETCKENKFDQSLSPYFEVVRDRIEDKQYGSFIHVKGKEVRDKVCLKEQQSCVDPFKFFLVSE